MNDIYKFTVSERWHSNTVPPCGASVVVKLTHAQALDLAVDLVRHVNAGVPTDFALHGELAGGASESKLASAQPSAAEVERSLVARITERATAIERAMKGHTGPISFDPDGDAFREIKKELAP